MANGVVGTAYRFWFGVEGPDGLLVTGIVTGDFTVTVRDPANSVTMGAPTVFEVGATGLYFFDILAAFSTTNGIGEYGVHVEWDSTTPVARGVVAEPESHTLTE